jgi:steroid delta-isomerase-like uncharacterized protein
MQRRTFLAGVALAAAPSLPQRADAADAPMAQKFADALNAHDLGAFEALFADDYVNNQRSAAAPPPAPGLTAKQATVAFFAARLKALPDLKVTIQTSLAEGDRVAASFAYEGRHDGVYYGVQPTGKHLIFTSCDIFRLANGRIAEHWGMGDIAGVVAQMKG